MESPSECKPRTKRCYSPFAMVSVHLFANAALYLVLAAWCTIAPDKTSTSIGYRFEHASARSEFLVVYGGLDLGLAIFYFVAGLDPSLHRAGILFSLCLYGCLAIYRLVTVLSIRGLGSFPLAMLAVEAGMVIWAVVLWLRMS